MEKTINVTPCEVSQVLPFLARVTRAKVDTSRGLATVQDICARSQAFKVESDGHMVGGYTLEVDHYDRGMCVFITSAAGSLEGVDLTSTISRLIEAQARQIGAKQVGFMTRRRGLAKKLAAQGWEVAGIKMVKKI